MVKFEKLTKEHIDEIVGIYIGSFNAEPWNDRWTIDTASKRIMQMINCEGFDGLLAYDDKRLVGMILGNHEYYYDGMIFQIKELCVDINYKGTGIGSKLLAEFEFKLKEKGIKKIVLYTLRNDKTEGFYNKHKYDSLNDMVVMEKEI